jgi:mRNA-degrading endonuclease RelE of RelBE toxin-antitoxin system
LKTYKILFPSKKIAGKFKDTLNKIPNAKLRKQISEEIFKLAETPRPDRIPKIKPPLQIFYKYTAQYRLRVKDYRVLYDIDDKSRIVWILVLRKRSEKTYK